MESQKAPASAKEPSQAPARKSYQKPQLQIYGDLAEITKSKFGATANDGAGVANMHFTS
jgi:hypothetical protein